VGDHDTLTTQSTYRSLSAQRLSERTVFTCIYIYTHTYIYLPCVYYYLLLRCTLILSVTLCSGSCMHILSVHISLTAMQYHGKVITRSICMLAKLDRYRLRKLVVLADISWFFWVSSDIYWDGNISRSHNGVSRLSGILKYYNFNPFAIWLLVTLLYSITIPAGTTTPFRLRETANGDTTATLKFHNSFLFDTT
jgi:hypothetical protein